MKDAIDRAAIEAVLAAGPAAGLRLAAIAEGCGLELGQRRVLREQLQQLMREGVVVRVGQRYRLQRAAPLPARRAGGPRGALVEPAPPEGALRGLLRVSPYGRGTVDIGEAFEGLCVAAEDRGPALDGDTVEVELLEGVRGRGGRRAARVVRVLSRGRVRLTGVLGTRRAVASGAGAPGSLGATRRPALALELDDPRIPHAVDVVDAGPGRPGDAVLAEIVGYPPRPEAPLVARVTRVLGEPGMLLTEVARSVAGAGIEEPFPAGVERAARALREGIDPGELEERADLRHLSFVTIDPQTARDFDDAVAIEPGPGGRGARVWIAVADVSHYVREDSAIDIEARRRGCSLYLPDRAIPMLPERISSQVGSLVPGEDRLAMVVELEVDESGEVRRDACMAAVIHSRGRLDYSGVAAALEGDLRGRRAGYSDHVLQLRLLREVARSLRARRMARGSLDLDLPEAQIVLDEDDPQRVRDVVESRPDAGVKRAYNLIEELMVAANEAVGRRFAAAGRDAVWRIHPAPESMALERLCGWLESYGVAAEPRRLRAPAGMARLLDALARHRARRPLSYLVLRTLKQASYSVTNAGHFGLASGSYLHFTSPIRRYPDLHVHRLFKQLLAATGSPAGRPPPVQQADPAALAAIASEASAAERRAIEVEREVRSLYAASLMRDRIGDEAGGAISGLSSFGFFVTLDRPFVEGLVRQESLDGRLDFDPERLRLAERRSGRVFSLGDRVRVRVIDVSVARRQIELAMARGPSSHEPDPAVKSERGANVAPRRRGARPAGPRRGRRRGGGI